MKITTRFVTTIPRSTNAILIPFFSDKDFVLPKLPSTIKNKIKKYVQVTEYKGNAGELGMVQMFSGSLSWIVLVGIGMEKKATPKILSQAFQKGFRQVQQQGASTAHFIIPLSLIKSVGALVMGRLVSEAAKIGCYSYQAFKSKKSKKELLHIILLTIDKKSLKELSVGAREGEYIANAIAMVRDYGNAPSNHITPTLLAEMAAKSAKATGQKITILNEKQMTKEKMGGILGVSKGSGEEARFIIIEHMQGKKGDAPIVLVGKGITFDSGGLSLKPSAGMDEMKFDMAGGASVIGAMNAIGTLKLHVNVVGLVPATENVPSGTAYKPGDILTYSDGTTVEVVNTDAEGRIILGDALLYARKYKPKVIIDLATLTGAIVVALADFATAIFSNNDQLADALDKASKITGESMWRMPLPAEAGPRVKSTVADIRNTSNKPGGGAITAAKFLENFIKKGTAWAHLDIAGMAWNTGATEGMEHGATGHAVKTLIEYVRKNA